MEAKIMSVTELKPRLLKIISRAQKLGQKYVVTRNGKPAAVIMSFDDWESWQETIAILCDPKARKRIEKSIAYFEKGGKGKTIEEIFGDTV